ncbi:MAG: hypothetical protein LBE70_05425 [Nitrososphaerota archaeon]|nr:hypothetical protein [Nitrososphaerota archaeon]
MDYDKNLLHELSLHLTANRCFQFEFDNPLCFFRTDMLKDYNRDKKKNVTTVKNYWYTMCVFMPFYRSMMRGEGCKQNKACITTGYENPTSFLQLCVGRRNDLANKFWSAAPESLAYAQYVVTCV